MFWSSQQQRIDGIQGISCLCLFMNQERAANNVSNRFHDDSNIATERLVWMQD